MIALIVIGAFAAYGTLSLARHATYRSTGFDLGLFDQVVWHYSRFETPASSIKGLGVIFGDHLSPILAALVPFSAASSDATGLLVAQALLVAASIVPVHLYAKPRVGPTGALLVAVAYALFGGLQEAIWFDVHEVAFAPLLIGLGVLWADRGRWRASFVAVALLLLVKEDFALVVAAFGAWYVALGQRRLGLATVALGIAWLVLATQVVIPHFAEDDYGYWTYTGDELFDPAKLKTTAYLFGAFLGLTLLSPLMLLAVPLLAERMLSDNPKLWTLEDHYSLAIAPVLALGAADGLKRLPRRARTPAAAVMAAIAVVATAVAFPLRDLADRSTYETPAAYAGADDLLDTIPAGASVAATNRLVPHLSRRDRIELLDADGTEARYVAAALDDGSAEGVFPFASRRDLRAAVARLRRRGYVPVRDAGGIVVLRRAR